MVSITCYGGTGQVGGNQILLEDGEVRLFLDFGIPFHQWSLFYEEYIKPRSPFGLLDPLETRLIPPLRGLYRRDMEDAFDGWERFEASPGYRDLRGKAIAGVLLSHAHLDHSGYISFLREDIPVLTTGPTALIAKAIQDSGKTDFEREVVYLIPKELREGLLEAGDYKKVAARQRSFRLLDASPLTDEVQGFWQGTPGARGLEARPLARVDRVGGLRARCFPVDHSIPGAAAYGVETSAGWVAYTGDLRRHGAQAPLTDRFVEEMARLRPRVLLCEGTRTTRVEDERGTSITEAQVAQRAFEAVAEAQGRLVFADFGPRNVERLGIFLNVARETGRCLVILLKDAYLLDTLRLMDPEVPEIGPEHSLLIYDEPKLREERWQKKVTERHKGSLIPPEEIQRNQEDYILCFGYFDINELPSIRPRPGSLYIYSSHEAFDEEQALDFQRLHNWLNHFQLRPLGLPREEMGWRIPEEERGLHSSGHASGPDLVDMIKAIRPQTLIPVHIEAEGYSYYEEALKGTGIEVLRPEYGKPITLR